MTYSYRQGAIIAFTSESGASGPGETVEYKAADGWKVEIQNEGCVEVSQYGVKGGAAPMVIPWHRIWHITSIS